MHATPGDWLIVESRTIGTVIRRGLIEEVRSPDGSPPYLVRWTDTDHRALTFPGPDARVLTPEELHAREAAAEAKFLT
ncbi:MAG: DUF1918 domain-containing protein [Mycobacteriaceae bacterium]|nr:DUF1918 domain-containing protein [Mycobacteriaceae bacterium]